MLLVPGAQLGDTEKTCYIGVFGTIAPGSAWSMGTMFTS